MSHKSIELHDSTINSVRDEEGRLEILFKGAYIHESSDVFGDDGTGWEQCARFVFYSPLVSGGWPVFPENIKSGVLEVGETIYDNVIHLPFNASGCVKIAIKFFSKEEVVILASRLEISLEGEAKYIESVPFDI